MRADELRQCTARHGQKMHLQCLGDTTTHIGLHWSVDRDGQTVRWDETAAMYPAVERLMVGEPGPEIRYEVREAREKLAAMGTGANRFQVGGDHYSKHKIQHWDIVQEYGLNYFEGAIVKYVLRHRGKNGVEDLKKARHTLDKLIEIEEQADGG